MEKILPTPSQTPCNVVNGLSAHSIISANLFSYFSALRKSLTNLCDLFFRQYCAAATFSVMETTLFNRVFHVIHLRSQEQMAWIKARWIVAFMQNFFAIWNRTIRNFPSKPMDVNTFSLQRNSSIAFVVRPEWPDHTFFSFRRECITYKGFDVFWQIAFGRLSHGTVI